MPMEYANVINISRFCTDDGPGIRTTVFLKGCPLRCAWCHNPESQKGCPEILWDQKACTGCGLCASLCTAGAHRIVNGQHTFDRNLCLHCGKCAKYCPNGALELTGNSISTKEVFEEVQKDAVFYTVSGGGITISGGEPLTHPAFTAELFRLCKDAGIHTAMETSGFASKNALEQVLPYCDLVLFDIKETNEETHKAYTGVSLKSILENLRCIDEMGISIMLRAPIIPGWNNREAHLLALKELKNTLCNCKGLQIMPYHSMGAYKYEKLQRQYLCKNVPEPDAETVALWKKLAE